MAKLNGFISGVASSALVIGSLSMYIINGMSENIKAMANQISYLQITVSSLSTSSQNLEKRLDRLEK